MSKELIDFTYGGPTTGDDGERGDGSTGVAAIKPLLDGNPATAATYNRPPENLRHRSEVLRTGLEDQRYLQDSDMHWIISAGLADGSAVAAPIPTITAFNIANGTFTISDPIVIQPLNTTDTDKKEAVTYGFPSGIGAGEITVTSLRYAFELGNQLKIVFVPTAPASIVAGVHGKCDLTVTGTNGHVLSFQFASDDTCDVDDFATLFALPAYIVVLTAAGFSCSTAGVGATLVTVADFDPPGSLPFEYELAGNADRELHRITAAVINAFFAVPANAMADGDTLALFFNDLVDPLGGNTGRRERVPGTGMTDVTAGELFITSHTPEWIPGAIPLCKRIGNSLLFLDGTLCTAAIPGTTPWPLTFGENGNTVNRIVTGATSIPVTMTAAWFGPIVPAWTTINGALNGIVGDLGDSLLLGGASKIGMLTTMIAHQSLGYYTVPAPGAGLQTIVAAILALLADKGSLDLGAFGAEETVSGRWLFDNHLRMDGDSVFLRTHMGIVGWVLTYRNDGATATNTDILWTTRSTYETVAAGRAGKIDVFGGYVSGTDIHTPAVGGSGIVTFVKTSGEETNSYVFGVRYAPALTTLGMDTPADWDYYYSADYNAGHTTLDITATGTDGTGGRPLTTQSIKVKEDFTTDSSIYVASLPRTCVLDGLYCLPESNTDPSIWTANQIRLSSGRALVNGIPISFATAQTLSNLHLSLMNDPRSVLPTDDTVADEYCYPGHGTPGVPGWYMLWLRSDASFFIGKCSPVYDASSPAIPGSSLYRPRPTEVHGGYTQADYVLLDVVCLWQYAGPNIYYFDCAMNVGGTERAFIQRELPTSLPAHDYIEARFDHQTASPATGLISTFANSAGSKLRSPGIPLGVTKNAIIGYAYDVTLGGGETVYNTVAKSSHLMFYPYYSHVTAAHHLWRVTATGLWQKQGSLNCILGGSGNIYRSFTSGGAGTIAYNLYVNGFHWDRSGVQFAL